MKNLIKGDIMTKKEAALDNLKYILEMYNIIRADYDYKKMEEEQKEDQYGPHEVNTLKAIKKYMNTNPSVASIDATSNLLNTVLSQALNRNPNLSWIIGVREASKFIGINRINLPNPQSN